MGLSCRHSSAPLITYLAAFGMIRLARFAILLASRWIVFIVKLLCFVDVFFCMDCHLRRDRLIIVISETLANKF